MVRYQSRSKTIVEKKIDFSYFEIACNIFNAEKKEFRTLSKEMNLGKNNNKRIYDFFKKNIHSDYLYIPNFNKKNGFGIYVNDSNILNTYSEDFKIELSNEENLDYIFFTFNYI